MGKKSKNSRKSQAKSVRKRVESSLVAANALSDPTDGLDPSVLTVKLKANAGEGVEGRLPRDGVVATEGGDSTTEDRTAEAREQFTVRIRCVAGKSLAPVASKSCLDLFETNMAEMYQRSSWGLDLRKKADEFRHERARFLLLEKVDAGNMEKSVELMGESSEGKDEILAFGHFRFEPDDDDHPKLEVLYLYELQVSPLYHRRGLGQKLMSIMEDVAKKRGMKKVVLTVFKANVAAMTFYKDGMGYGVDETSPSKFGEDADYEILSKAIDGV